MFQFAHRGTQGTAKVREFPVEANQTLTTGEPVNLESGYLTAAAAADQDIVGIMAQDAGNLAKGSMVQVILADEDTEFWADFIGTTKTELTAADIGTAFNLSASDNTIIDLDNTIDGMWVYMGKASSTRGLFKLKAANRADIVG